MSANSQPIHEPTPEEVTALREEMGKILSDPVKAALVQEYLVLRMENRDLEKKQQFMEKVKEITGKEKEKVMQETSADDSE
ncbi:unnamed protein product [Caenorhabditis sp. 36 PRJEB53466]|nr:unnamed protein product [Caenorhabditis sp. 36 PRJEB53466]